MLMSSALYAVDVCVATYSFTVQSAVALWYGRGAIRQVAREGRLRVARPDVGELCIATVPGWRRSDTYLSRGTRPLPSRPRPSTAEVLEVRTVGGDDRVASLLTRLAPSLHTDVAATSGELATLAGAAVGLPQDQRVTVVFADFSSATFGRHDTVVTEPPGGAT